MLCLCLFFSSMPLKLHTNGIQVASNIIFYYSEQNLICILFPYCGEFSSESSYYRQHMEICMFYKICSLRFAAVPFTVEQFSICGMLCVAGDFMEIYVWNQVAFFTSHNLIIINFLLNDLIKGANRKREKCNSFRCSQSVCLSWLHVLKIKAILIRTCTLYHIERMRM